MSKDAWWQEGVLYQIYPRSYADSTGDGHGDLAGIRGRLDHLEWLGIDGIWLSPTMPSPNRDWGYDVSDYCGVHPDFGTLEDLDALVADARSRGIAVLLDLVPNHTSDEHPWFVEASGSRDAARRDFYVWADPAPGGGPPTNWRSNFGGSAWTLDEGSGQYYLHNFLPSQPDLNWWSDAVRDEFDRILRFWLDRGVAGFRIDVAHSIVKDRLLRDDPVATDADHPHVRARGTRQEFSMNRPEVHDVFRRWRALSDAAHPPGILVGETYVLELDQLIPYYGAGEDELHLAFNFLFVHAELAAAPMRAIVEQMESALPPASWPVWTGSNHDAGRLATRWAGGDEDRARVALMLLLTLRGTPFLYAGDELALGDVEVPREAWRDPVGETTGRPEAGRDGCRTPMPWTPGPGAGFTTPEATPWLPIGLEAGRTVAEQRADRGSVLHLVRDLIGLRRDESDLHRGTYASLPSPDGAWAYARGDGHAVALNLSGEPVAVEGIAGRVLICTHRRRDGERVAGRLELGPWTGAVVAAR
jgi:alpha-glucosidase